MTTWRDAIKGWLHEKTRTSGDVLAPSAAALTLYWSPKGWQLLTVSPLSVTGLAGPRLSRNVRFEWLHRDSPGRLCQV